MHFAGGRIGTCWWRACCSKASLLPRAPSQLRRSTRGCVRTRRGRPGRSWRSEEHTSELQSLRHLVCRLLLEKKKKKNITNTRNVETQSTSAYRNVTPPS